MLLATQFISQAAIVALQGEDDHDYVYTIVNPNYEKVQRLMLVRTGPLSMFTTLLGFYLFEFESLSSRICPPISLHTRSRREERKAQYRHTPLASPARLLSCSVYLRHSNSVRCEADYWNYCPFSSLKDVYFIYDIINKAVPEQISLPNAAQPHASSDSIEELSGSAGFIDGILFRICQQHVLEHKEYYNEKKKCPVLTMSFA